MVCESVVGSSWKVFLRRCCSSFLTEASYCTNKFQKYSDTLAPRHATKYEVAGAKAPRRPNTFEIC